MKVIKGMHSGSRQMSSDSTVRVYTSWKYTNVAMSHATANTKGTPCFSVYVSFLVLINFFWLLGFLFVLILSSPFERWAALK